MHSHAKSSSFAGFIAPFALFTVLMALRHVIPLPQAWEYPFRVVATTATILLLSRNAISWSPSQPGKSVILGVLVFFIWIAPDLLFPAYRSHWLFQNSLTGLVTSSVSDVARSSLVFIVFRIFGTALVVPIIEELFWRGCVMRYSIRPDFLNVPLGSYTRFSFWFTAILFASEHGPFWDVGLLAGIAYNWWMVHTRNLADCMIAHGVTNACLAYYVLNFDQWQYWL